MNVKVLRNMKYFLHSSKIHCDTQLRVSTIIRDTLDRTMIIEFASTAIYKKGRAYRTTEHSTELIVKGPQPHRKVDIRVVDERE